MVSVQARGGVLPASTSELIGRQTELTRLSALLAGGARLITLVGPGGIGKTRLAAEALRRAHRGRHRPVYWARLAELECESTATAEDVVQCAVRTGMTTPPARDVLVSTFASGDDSADRAVLVLDNCEHLLDTVGPMIADLLERAPGLTILATSREPIGWVDEYILSVPPLAPQQSLELFRQRAELVGRKIPDDPDQLAVAARICRRVEHNPLFIRLAAARLRHQPPAKVLRELTGDADDKRLNWTHGARAGAEERHRGVYDVVAWSFALCGATEQLMLERLSVFAAGYETDDESPRTGIDLDAVIAVCADDTIPADQIERLLDRLGERSLLSVHLTPTTVGWSLLESVHVFARDRLRRRDRDEAERLGARHRRYFRDRVVAGQAMWYGPDDEVWLSWVRSAWDDIVLGIETGLADPAEAVVGLETATVLLSMWVPFVKGGGRALTWLTERAVEATRACSPEASGLVDLATALLGWIALWQGRTERVPDLLDHCVAPGSVQRVRAGWRESAQTDVGLSAPVEWMWGLELMMVRRDPRAITVLARARSKFADLGDRIGMERSDVFVAFCAALVGDRKQALDLTARYLARSASSGSDLSTDWAAIARAVALAKHGDADEARAMTRAVLTRNRLDGDMWTASWAVGADIVALARILLENRESGDHAKSTAAATEIAYLVGSFKTRQRSMGVAIDQVPMLATELRTAVEVSREVLGARAYAAAERRTRLRPELGEFWRHTTDPAPTEVRSDALPASQRLRTRWGELSRAERDVAVFAAAGWPNSAIAALRRSSIRTVDAQVATIRQKLMISSRNDIARFIPDDLADRVRQESERKPSRSRRTSRHR